MRSCAAPVLAEGSLAVGSKLLGLSGPVEAPPRDQLVSRAPPITISCCPARPARRHCLLRWSRWRLSGPRARTGNEGASGFLVLRLMDPQGPLVWL